MRLQNNNIILLGFCQYIFDELKGFLKYLHEAFLTPLRKSRLYNVIIYKLSQYLKMLRA